MANQFTKYDQIYQAMFQQIDTYFAGQGVAHAADGLGGRANGYLLIHIICPILKRKLWLI